MPLEEQTESACSAVSALPSCETGEEKTLPLSLSTQTCGHINSAHHCMLVPASLPCVPVMGPLRIGCVGGFKMGLPLFVHYCALLWRTKAYTVSVSSIIPKKRWDLHCTELWRGGNFDLQPADKSYRCTGSQTLQFSASKKVWDPCL